MGYWFVIIMFIIGKGIMFVIKDGWVIMGVFSIVSEDSCKVVFVLNNVYYLDKMYYSIEGKDIYYFVKIGLVDGDLVILGIIIGCKVLESGVNVIVF